MNSKPRWTHSLRFRLTLWYTGVLGALLLLASGLLYGGARYTLRTQTDAFLASEAHQFTAADSSEADDLEEVVTQQPGHSGAAPGPGGPLLFDVVYTRLLQRPSLRTLAASPDLKTHPALAASLDPLLREKIGAEGRFSFAGPDEEQQMRVLTMPVRIEKSQGWLQVAVPWDHNADVLEHLVLLLALGLPAVLLLAGAGGWILVGRTLQPIGRIVAEAERLDAAALPDALLPQAAESDSEIGHLVTTLNQMTTRLRRAFDVQRRFAEAQQRFAADASHELRTPLTILRGEMELALSRPREAGVYQATLASAVEEIDRMSRIVAGLGFLAREDGGQMKPARLDQRADLRHLCERAGEELAAKASGKGVRLEILESGTNGAVWVPGNPDQLYLLLRNLLDNAVKYTAAGGNVTVTLRQEGSEAAVLVSDTGIGIAEDDLPFVFDRFWRADRARASEGSGLGLAISKRIADAHGGILTVDSEPACGTTFRLALPLGITKPQTE